MTVGPIERPVARHRHAVRHGGQARDGGQNTDLRGLRIRRASSVEVTCVAFLVSVARRTCRSRTRSRAKILDVDAARALTLRRHGDCRPSCGPLRARRRRPRSSGPPANADEVAPTRFPDTRQRRALHGVCRPAGGSNFPAVRMAWRRTDARSPKCSGPLKSGQGRRGRCWMEKFPPAALPLDFILRDLTTGTNIQVANHSGGLQASTWRPMAARSSRRLPRTRSSSSIQTRRPGTTTRADRGRPSSVTNQSPIGINVVFGRVTPPTGRCRSCCARRRVSRRCSRPKTSARGGGLPGRWRLDSFHVAQLRRLGPRAGRRDAAGGGQWRRSRR